MLEVSRLATVATALCAALALAALVSHDISRRAAVARHRSMLLSSPSSVLVKGSVREARRTHRAFAHGKGADGDNAGALLLGTMSPLFHPLTRGAWQDDARNCGTWRRAGPRTLTRPASTTIPLFLTTR